MTAHEGPAPQPTGTGPTENVAATKPLSLNQHASREGVTCGIEWPDVPDPVPLPPVVEDNGLSTRRHPQERFGQRLHNSRRRSMAAARAAERADGVLPQERPCARSLHVQVGKQTAWLKGEDVRELLVFAQINPEDKSYDLVHAAWAVPLTVADQVVIAAEWWQRRHITREAVDR